MTLSYWWACFEHSLPVDAGNIEGNASDEKKDVGEATQSMHVVILGSESTQV